MKTVCIWNFSYSLSDLAIQQIIDELGAIDLHQIEMKIDQEKPIRQQIYEICQVAQAEGRPRPDYIILPEFAPAAVHVDRYFAISEDDYPPTTTYIRLIHLKKDSSAPPFFVLGSIE